MFRNSKARQKNDDKIVKYNFNSIVHDGSRTESNVFLNKIPQGRVVVNLIKTGAGIVSLKMFNEHVDIDKKILKIYGLDVEEFVLKSRWRR